jgi:hypothetical protein
MVRAASKLHAHLQRVAVHSPTVVGDRDGSNGLIVPEYGYLDPTGASVDRVIDQVRKCVVEVISDARQRPNRTASLRRELDASYRL